MESNKHQIEKYAFLRIIKYYRPDLEKYQDSMTKQEPPDFYIKELGLGIEITESMFKDEGEIRAIDKEFFGKGMTPNVINEIIANRKYKERVKRKLKYKSLAEVMYREITINDVSERINMLFESIDKKTKILNKNKSAQSDISQEWLYILPLWSLFERFDIDEVVNKWENIQKEYNYNFDKIFIDCRTKIYVIEKEKGLDYQVLDVGRNGIVLEEQYY